MADHKEDDAVMRVDIKVGLAPMAGFTDSPFRRMCAEQGADYAVSEMISAVALTNGDKKTAALAEIGEGEAPCALLLFGHDPGRVAEATAILAEGRFGKPCAIEINMGCPVKKIVTSGDGSALMRSPELAEKIVERAAREAHAASLLLWVKIRAGWSANSVNAPSFAQALVSKGADRITVHGRTREQMYAPSSRNDVIRAVKEAVGDGAEVFGNGDITCGGDAVSMIDETGCDGVLVGRAALGDPWIFKEIKAALSGGTFEPPSVEDRVGAAIRLLCEICSSYGEETGVCAARGRAAHFIKGIRGSAAVRGRLNRAATRAEFESILKELLQGDIT